MIEAVQSCPRPTSPTDIRNFLDLTDYHRKFVEGFSSISSPLTKLTQKTVKLKWFEACEKKLSKIEEEVDYWPDLDLMRRYSRFCGVL